MSAGYETGGKFGQSDARGESRLPTDDLAAGGAARSVRARGPRLAGSVTRFARGEGPVPSGPLLSDEGVAGNVGSVNAVRMGDISGSRGDKEGIDTGDEVQNAAGKSDPGGSSQEIGKIEDDERFGGSLAQDQLGGSPKQMREAGPGHREQPSVADREDESSPADDSPSQEQTISEHHGWQPVHVLFYYSPHYTAADMQRIPEFMATGTIDMYVDEDASTGGQNAAKLQELADLDASKQPADFIQQVLARTSVRSPNGEVRPLSETNFAPVFEGIYASGTQVRHVDLQGGDQEAKFENLLDAYSAAYVDADPEQTFNNLLDALTEAAHTQEQREENMPDRLEALLAAELDPRKESYLRDPALREQPYTVLFPMGSVHSGLLDQQFRDKGFSTSREYPSKPYRYSYFAQAERSIRFGIAPTKDLLAKAHMENCIVTAMNEAMTDASQSEDQSIVFQRYLASQFTTDEIVQLHPTLIQNARQVIEQALQDKSLGALPTTNAELAAAVERLRS